MQSSLVLRPVDPGDTATLDAWMAHTALVFTAPFVPGPERREVLRPRYAGQRLSGVFDGDRIVGTYRGWDWNLTVPGGGTVAAAAVSSVTVRPSHRRRGVLTSMITPDLTEARTRGLPVAVLIASEATIYGRFGFGAATESATWELDLAAARLAADVPRSGSVDVVDPGDLRELRAVAPAVFTAARSAGATDRSDHWWDVHCGVITVPGDDHGPRAAVVHRDPVGDPQGFAIWGWKERWEGRACRTVATVEDLYAATPEAYAALWGLLAGLDLVATVRARDRPVDEPLPWLLTDPRAARRTATCDFLWLRVLDPVAALAARRYESSGRIVLSVTDPLGHAAGTVALVVAEDGLGRASPADATDAELTLPVDVLSSLYLGGGDLRAVAMAGRVVEHRPGSVERVARLLRTTRPPWTGTWF